MLALLPGLYVALVAAALAWALRRWYDPLPARVLAAFALLLALLFGPVLFAGRVLLPVDNLRFYVPYGNLEPSPSPGIGLQRDLVHQITPWVLEVRRTVRAGHWPLWNAHAGAGMPLAADPQAQAFQPLVVAAYPFPTCVAAGVTAALRVLVALVFTFLLLRGRGMGEAAALCGAVAYGLGGFLLLWLGWPIANCAALLPAVLYGLALAAERRRRRDFLLLALAVFSLLLGGHPETMIYALAMSGLFLLDLGRERWRRQGRAAAAALLARSSLALALAGGAAAPVLLPTADYLPQTQRTTLVAHALPPLSPAGLWAELQRPAVRDLWRRRATHRLLQIFAPRALGDQHFYWGDSNYIQDAGGFVGSATLLAALLALVPLRGRHRFPQERLFAIVLFVSLFLLGQPPGFDRLTGRLPLVGPTAIHKHQRVQVLVALSLAYLAACEVERWRRGERRRALVLAAAAALAALIAWGYLAHPNPYVPALLAEQRRFWLGTHLAVLAFTVAALLAPPAGRAGRWLAWSFGALVSVELLLAHLPANPPQPARLAFPVTPPIEFLKQHLGDDRLLGLGMTFPANFPLFYGLNDVRIDNPAAPGSYVFATSPVSRPAMVPLYSRPRHPLYDLLGVRYVITRPRIELPLRRVFRHWTGWVYERPNPLPRLFLPAAATTGSSLVWRDWLDANPDFAALALVPAIPGGAKGWRALAPAASILALAPAGPARLAAHALLAEPRLLAAGVYQDGNWHLLADGERRPTLVADGPFVAAWLPAGEWDLRLVYLPACFVAGCLLAALAVAVAAAWWVPPPQVRVLS
jgi:hypothetical protein